MRQNPAIFRGMGATDVASLWPIFFYRFVNPAERSETNLTYARRVATAEAQVLPSCGLRHS